MGRNRADDQRAAVNELLAQTGQASYEWDILSDKLVWSENFCGLAGLTGDAAIETGRGFEAVLSSDGGQSRYGVIFAAEPAEAGTPSPFQCTYALAADHVRGGQPVWIEDTGVWFANETGKPARARGVVRVVSERRNREDQLRHRSDHDDMTGLPNRRLLEMKLGATIEECLRGDGRAALLVLGIDRMDLINDFYGFDVGDEVLRHAGQIIASKLRSDDVVARFSGAKFGVLLRECSGIEIYTAGRRFLDALRKDVIKLAAGPVSINATIGACQLPRHATGVNEAVAAAFAAHRVARSEGNSRISIYDPDPDKRIRRRQDAELATRVIESLEKGAMRLAFQPVVEAQTGRVAFHEALMRIEREDGVIMGAGSFLPLAEKLGFMSGIDIRAIDLAIDTLCTYPQSRLSINVSNASAEDPEWLSKLARRLQSSPGAASRLVVEITESHAASDLAEAQKFVSILRSIGCKIAVDDFGAGYTSFANLKALPVDIIKIDGTFAKDLDTNKQNQVFIRSLLDLARAFDVKTVVEWVENTATARMLADWGVDYLQGHCFGQASIACPWGGEDESYVAPAKVVNG